MAYDDYRLLRITIDGAICRATIDNPPVNLLDMPLIGEIDRLTREVADDETLRVLVVDSADPEFFIAHADVGLIRDLPADDLSLHDTLSPFNAVMERFRALPKATIAVIEGTARGGGCEFAMAFDMRYAALGTTVLGPSRGGRRHHPRRRRYTATSSLDRSRTSTGSDPRLSGHRRRDRCSVGLSSTARCPPTNCDGSSTSSPNASRHAR